MKASFDRPYAVRVSTVDGEVLWERHSLPAVRTLPPPLYVSNVWAEAMAEWKTDTLAAFAAYGIFFDDEEAGDDGA